MSFNDELAQIFTDMAAMLELTGATVFRVSAHQNTARAIKDLPGDIRDLADQKKKLVAIDGIGSGNADRIIEYIQTGEVKDHEELLEKVPRGLIDVLEIPGLGPKTVKLIWEKANITDLESLSNKLESGELEQLPRLGKKSIQNIRKSLQFMRKSGERARIGKAMPIAERIVNQLAEIKGVKKVQYAGSLRRGQETIGDIDILACSDSAHDVAEKFRRFDDVEQVLVAGDTKTSVRLKEGIQADLRIVPEEAFGAALMYFTGSKEHNIALRERAIKRSMRLNEYGLFEDDDPDNEKPPQDRDIEPIASRTEEEIYDALDLPWRPPELRQLRSDVDRTIPDDLITLEDVRSELHAHTKASDGRLTIKQLAEEAKSRGFHTIAVTDHSKSSVQAGGLSEDQLREHIGAVREADDDINGITVLAGSEVDILVDGTLDYDDELLAELDIVVASPHAALTQDPQTATKRLLAAIKHPLVHIIGHPTGRVINKRDGLSPDMIALIDAAIANNTALEVNSNHMRLDLRDTHVRAVVDAGGLIAINTDAHRKVDFDQLRYGIVTARRGWLTKHHCINAWSKQKLHTWLKSKR